MTTLPLFFMQENEIEQTFQVDLGFCSATVLPQPAASAVPVATAAITAAAPVSAPPVPAASTATALLSLKQGKALLCYTRLHAYLPQNTFKFNAGEIQH